ncbi:MAG: LAGLIDADG family homing endonuclease [Candidatus Woesearchaeota archaeon]
MNAPQSQNIIITEDIAYLIGVLQSDGCIYNFYDKKEGRNRIRLSLGVGKNSLPMSEKFKQTLEKILGIHVNIRKSPAAKNAYIIQTSINRTACIFIDWKKEALNNEIRSQIELFGAYLAGLIDGDGHIQIKHNRDRKIPQCRIEIAEDRPMKTVQHLLNKFFGCEAHFEKCRTSQCVETCFYVSKKNIKLLILYVYPHLTITHKKETLQEFFEIKKRALEDSNP